MIGIVVVSHSAKLAEGVVDLARGMVGTNFPIAAAGGLADQSDILGTDALRVLRAIESVYGDDGVLVLMDLGSAILSAETALDFLSEEMRPRVALCPAPLVEGTIAAAVAAQNGLPLDAVAEAARGALAAKAQQLGEPAEQPASPLVLPAELPHERTITLTVPNRLGLHARPAARLVEIAGRFDADVHLRNLTNGRGAVSAASFNGVILLGAVGGHQLEVSASGADTEQALAAVQDFAAANFGDPPDADRSPSPTATPLRVPVNKTQNRLKGLPVSPGIAVGKAAQYRPALPPIPSAPAGDVQTEAAALRDAVERTKAQIEAQRSRTERQAGTRAAGIFAAHLAFLADQDLATGTQRLIAEERLSAAAAWKQTTDDLIAQYRQLESEYLQARAADVEAVQAQVLAQLLGTAVASPTLREPAILIARDLTPAEIGALDKDMVLGILTAEGSPTSHAAILARTLGIPMIVGMGAAVLAVSDGMPLAIDGETGEIVLEPEADVSAAFARLASQFRVRQENVRRESALPARTADGQRVEVFANIGSLADAKRSLELGAEGVGVLRTEFLFMQRETPPDTDEQYAACRAIAQAMGGRPLVIRTLDAGGDKLLPYLDQRREDNPFLGLRAIRLCLANPDFFRAQLEAIVRTADEFPVRVMFPMIATIEEFRAAKALLDACGHPANPIQTGMMVEIPSAAECAEAFAPEVDFFSIGTNDLTQYAFAAERGNPQLAYLADALHPVILRMIRRVVAAGRAYGRPVAVCGEMASDPAAIPILLGLGVDELSMNPAAIPQAKEIIRRIRREDAVELAKRALEQANAEDVRRLVGEWNE